MILKLLATFTLATPLCTGIAAAQDEWESWPLGDPFTIYLSAMFPTIDTKVRVDSPIGEAGTTVDFEQNLGMSDSETLPALGFQWRFAKKHSLRFDMFDLDRSGSAITTTEIRFGDKVFQANLPISSYFDTRVMSVAYSYSLLFDAKKELAFTAGLSVQDIQYGIFGNGNVGKIEAESGITAPLPAFGLSGGYAFTDKWIIEGGFGWFSMDLALSDEKELKGDIAAGSVYLRHNTFENVHFALGYHYFDISAEFELDLSFNAVSYQYHGPTLRISAAF